MNRNGRFLRCVDIRLGQGKIGVFVVSPPPPSIPTPSPPLRPASLLTTRPFPPHRTVSPPPLPTPTAVLFHRPPITRHALRAAPGEPRHRRHSSVAIPGRSDRGGDDGRSQGVRRQGQGGGAASANGGCARAEGERRAVGSSWEEFLRFVHPRVGRGEMGGKVRVGGRVCGFGVAIDSCVRHEHISSTRRSVCCGGYAVAPADLYAFARQRCTAGGSPASPSCVTPVGSSG